MGEVGAEGQAFAGVATNDIAPKSPTTVGDLGGHRPRPAHPGGRVNVGEVAETLGLAGIDRAAGGVQVDEEEAEAVALLAGERDLRAIGRPGRAAILAAVGQTLA